MSPIRDAALAAAVLVAACTYLVPSRCSNCPDDLECTPEGFCPESCNDFDVCSSGFVCQSGECELACREASCDRGNTCDSLTNRCQDSCVTDSECQSGWVCCVSTFDCRDERVLTCVRE